MKKRGNEEKQATQRVSRPARPVRLTHAGKNGLMRSHPSEGALGVQCACGCGQKFPYSQHSGAVGAQITSPRGGEEKQSEGYRSMDAVARRLVERSPEFAGRDPEDVAKEFQRELIEGAVAEVRSVPARASG